MARTEEADSVYVQPPAANNFQKPRLCLHMCDAAGRASTQDGLYRKS